MSDIFNVRFNTDKKDSNRVSKDRPPPKSDDSFRKIVAKEQKEHEDAQQEYKKVKKDKKLEEREKRIASKESRDESRANLSLFDLSANASKVERKSDSTEEAEEIGFEEEVNEVEEEPVAGLDDEVHGGTLSALAGLGSKSKEKFAIEKETPEIGQEEAGREKQGVGARFAQEQPDLSYVNPMANTSMSAAVAGNTAPQQTIAAELQQVIDKMTEELQTMQMHDRTDTSITLKNSQLFGDVKIVMTEFDSAKGEFNLKFENLTQQAKDILDQNMNGLKLALEQKGHVVHIITTTTTTETESPLDVKESHLAKRDQEGQEEEAEKQKKGEKEA